jgi:uncharacterized protein
LMTAAMEGHVEVLRWLADKGVALNEWNTQGCTALWLACLDGRTSAVRLLLERGADPSIAGPCGGTPLMTATQTGHLEVVRVLLGNPSGETTINERDEGGATALWWACSYGRGGFVRALLESGADPTMADTNGRIPMDIAKQDPPPPLPDHPGLNNISAEGRRECVAALEGGVLFWALWVAGG